MKKKVKLILVGTFLCFVGSLYLSTKYIELNKETKEKKEAVQDFFNKELEINNKKIKTKSPKYDYISVLEIPIIDLKQGIVDINSIYNNIEYNIKIIDGSNMPDIEGTNLILAAHSGTSSISYFKNLDKLKISDFVYVYYNKRKYIYQIDNIYEEIKDGNISINKNSKDTILVLTTCNPNDNGYQIIIICVLKDIIPFYS